MEFRYAVPASILLGAMLGTTLVAFNVPADRAPAPESSGVSLSVDVRPSLVSEAAAAEVTEEPIARELPTARNLPIVRNASVQRFVTLFEGRRSDLMTGYLKRSGRYEGMIRAKLRERGMPQDLFYLAMIESGFKPTAYSHAHASGLWQFIADTGRRYGLRIDDYVDERRHPERSTDAALDYLQDLHGIFGSWSLAAAGYNTGEGRVSRIMQEETGSVRGREVDFWRIRHRLPEETQAYVPLMFAAAVIGKEPQKYGLGHVERWLPVATERVVVPSGTRLETVARAVSATEEEIRALNPHLIRAITPPGEKYPVYIPAGRSPLFSENFERVREETLPVRTVKRGYQVRKGDSLAGIARRYGVSVAALQKENRMGPRTAVRVGQVVRIPRGSE